MIRMPRIEALLGVATLDDVDAAALQRLVDGRVPEDPELEYKQSPYGNSDSDKRELAKDVAALANGRGGVIVIGIQADDGDAAALTPADAGETEQLRIQQVIASLIAPVPLYELYMVRGAAGVYFLVVVPRSAQAPHAVRAGDGLRYARRDGSHTRFLSEPEVAAAYRSRFDDAARQLDRMTEITVAGREALGPSPGWLLLTMVPNVPGDTGWSTQALRDVQDWIGRRADANASRVFLHDVPAHEIGVKPRRFVSHYLDENGKASWLHFEFNRDGAGIIAVNLWGDEPRGIPEQTLAAEIITGLWFLAGFAQDCAGVWGDATADVWLTARPQDLQIYSGGDFSIARTTMATAPARSQSMLSIADATSPAGAATAAKPILDDIWSAFGTAEAPYIDADGDLQLARFNSTWRQALQPWLLASE